MKKMSVIVCAILFAACASTPKSSSDYLANSESYYKKGNLQAAVQSAQKAVELDPNNASAYSVLGSVYYEMGDYNNAIKSFEYLYKSGDKRSEVLSALGAAYAAKNDYKNATKYIDEALAKDSANVSALTTKAGIYYAQKEYQKAVDTYTKAIKYAPSRALYNARAAAYEKMNKLDEAVKDYNRAGVKISMAEDEDTAK